MTTIIFYLFCFIFGYSMAALMENLMDKQK